MHARRSLRALLVPAAVVALALSACSAPSTEAPSTPGTGSGYSISADEVQKNKSLIDQYVALEREQLPQILALYPDMYETVQIKGDLVEGAAGTDPITGTFADFQFEYVFAEVTDWDAANANFEGMRDQFDAGCAQDLFPNLQKAGMSVPIAITYKYTDVSLDSWQFIHTCTTK